MDREWRLNFAQVSGYSNRGWRSTFYNYIFVVEKQMLMRADRWTRVFILTPACGWIGSITIRYFLCLNISANANVVNNSWGRVRKDIYTRCPSNHSEDDNSMWENELKIRNSKCLISDFKSLDCCSVCWY